MNYIDLGKYTIDWKPLILGIAAFLIVLGLGGVSASVVVLMLGNWADAKLSGSSLFSSGGLLGFLYPLFILIASASLGWYLMRKYQK